MATTSQNIFFNTLNVQNDLEGELQGGVLLAQAAIIPSRAAAIPDDIQPHLVSLRDTLLLFKPITTGINNDSSVTLNITDNNNNTVYSTTLRKPESLTRPAEAVEAEEQSFINPITPQFTIDQQRQFDQMVDDKDGRFLLGLFELVDIIKINTSDYNWIRNIYLPDAASLPENKVIIHEHIAQFYSTIYYSGKTIRADLWQVFYFKNVKGTWVIPTDLPHTEAITTFIEPAAYDITLSSSAEIKSIGNDPNATTLRSQLEKNDQIKISMGDARWADNIYLPEGDPSLDGKKIVFWTTAKYPSYIHYSGISITISSKTALAFINKNGRWIEWSDALYSRISYGENFWSAIIPWQYITPGISFAFQTNGITGIYRDAAPGAATELVLHTIDIGMLTPYRADFTFQSDDDYHRQYFQQTPVSRLVVNQYEPVYWQEIMLPDGTLYRDHSNDNGDIYSGDLRQRIGKELICLGINNANYGITSSPGTGESGLSHPFVAAQFTVTNSVGGYSNGRVVHGGSGGGGMVTIESSIGNEFSHEVGHNYGLSHYPNGFNGSVHRPANNINSTWGWDSDKDLFLPNFEKRQTGTSSCYNNQCQEPFEGHRFGFDAMAGGTPMYPFLNNYTLYTPHSLNKIQIFMESKIVFDASFSSGYSKWNEQAKAMEEWAEYYLASPDELTEDTLAALFNKYKVIESYLYNGHFTRDIYMPPANTANKNKGIRILYEASYNITIHVNNTSIPVSKAQVLHFESDGTEWKQIDDFSFNYAHTADPEAVPVTTILGYYDPENSLPGYIYPALHCAWGRTFPNDLPFQISQARCYAVIKNKENKTLQYLIRDKRLVENTMNRLHINVPSSFAPTNITIYSDGVAITTRDLEPPTGGTRFTVHGRK